MINAVVPRLNYNEIVKIVEKGSTVLDLGCGNGELLARLINEKNVRGRGVDLEEAMVRQCIARGISVFQGNLDEGLKDYATASYDYVILNQTLQVTHQPMLIVEEMLRVGKRAIVSFPNFGFYRLVLQLLFRRRMPVTNELPYQWHNTPNIHLCTRQDFIDQCGARKIIIERIVDIGQHELFCRFWPNMRATDVIFVLKGRP